MKNIRSQKVSQEYRVVRADGDSIPYSFQFRSDAEASARCLNESNLSKETMPYKVVETVHFK